jgi:uncharacterized membrane protein YkvA (DUF1232 family)
MKDDVFESKEIPADEQENIQDRIVDMDDAKLKFYEDLRKKAKGWTKEKTGSMGGKISEYLFLLPDFFILVCRLAVDKRVPAKHKLKVAGIIAYLIMPIDIIPDFIPVIGYVDDLVLVVWVSTSSSMISTIRSAGQLERRRRHPAAATKDYCSGRAIPGS